jgi:prepilin-type N-terminal cleavage/methylation domain-containing protein
MMKRAFTLIELLIVVAIIAILAAIAVPNFLEAQTRAKISRNKADMRTAVTALETYRLDWNKYPYDGYSSGSPPPGFNYWFLPYMISTPVAYLNTAKIVDPFRPGPTGTQHWQWNDVRYRSIGSTWGQDYDGKFGGEPPAGVSTWYGPLTVEFGGYVLNAAGPDKTYGPYGWKGVSTYPVGSQPLPYNATNGTVSNGDIIRSSVNPENGYKNAG